jgi:hypothetical protein
MSAQRGFHTPAPPWDISTNKKHILNQEMVSFICGTGWEAVDRQMRNEVIPRALNSGKKRRIACRLLDQAAH